MATAILQVISRADAISLGQKRYFTGLPCVHGHIAARSVGRNNQCVECKRIQDKNYGELHKSDKRDYDAKYRQANLDKILDRHAEYRAQNKAQLNLKAAADRAANPQKYIEYRAVRTERRSIEIKNWRNRNKAHVRDYAKRHLKRHKEAKSQFWLATALRQRLAMAVRDQAKAGSAVRDLGCSVSDFMIYMESKFSEGMSWANWGRKGWHIDHIRPLAAFDLSDPMQFKAACHYTNLQPLWWYENIAKGARID